MKKNILFILLFCSLCSYSQTFKKQIIRSVNNSFYKFADLDNDGFMDKVFFPNSGDKSIAVTFHFLNTINSDSIYRFRFSDTALSSSIIDLSLMDVDNDGYEDIIFSCDKRIYILRNERNKKFTVYKKLAVSNEIDYMHVMDKNADGYDDIVLFDFCNYTILLNDRNGKFNLSIIKPYYCLSSFIEDIYEHNYSSMKTVEFNNDGKSDIFFKKGRKTNVFINSADSFIVKNIGDGYTDMADVNGDHILDYLYNDGYNGSLMIMNSNGSGTTTFSVPKNKLLKFVYYDNDSLPDIIYSTFSTTQTTDSLILMKNLGNNKFEHTILDYSSNTYVTGNKYVDVDIIKQHDTSFLQSLIITDYDASKSFFARVYIYKNSNNQFVKWYDDFNYLQSFRIIDWNNDGLSDIVFEPEVVGGIHIYWMKNIGNLQFAKAVPLIDSFFSDYHNSTIFFDINHDGFLDVITKNINSIPQLREYLNNSNRKIYYSSSKTIDSLSCDVSCDLWTYMHLNSQNSIEGIFYDSQNIPTSYISIDNNGNVSKQISLSFMGSSCPACRFISVDVNNDGYNDILKYVSTSVNYYVNNRNNTFTSAAFSLPVVPNDKVLINYLDINNDGKKDLIFNDGWMKGLTNTSVDSFRIFSDDTRIISNENLLRSKNIDFYHLDGDNKIDMLVKYIIRHDPQAPYYPAYVYGWGFCKNLSNGNFGKLVDSNFYFIDSTSDYTSNGTFFLNDLDKDGDLDILRFNGSIDITSNNEVQDAYGISVKDLYVYENKSDLISSTINHKASVQNLLIYPNPSSDYFNVEIKDGIKINSNELFISIIDITGKEIAKYNFTNQENNRVQLNVKNYSKGLYFINLVDQNNIIETQKIIIQ